MEMSMKVSRKAGFTLVEIMIVVAIVGILAGVMVPNIVKARTLSQKNICIANLKQIDSAKHTWAYENNKANTEVPTDADLFGYDKYLVDKPACPGGGADYITTIGNVATAPACSLSALGHVLP